MASKCWWAPTGSLARTLDAEGFALGRLKTGTPPRLDARTVDFSAMQRQPSDADPIPFSFLNMAQLGWRPPAEQVQLSRSYLRGSHQLLRAGKGLFATIPLQECSCLALQA